MDAQRLIFEYFGLKVSTAAIKRARKKLGWVKSGVRYCQLVKEKNRIERLVFAQNWLATKEDFSNIIFTDESSIWLENHAKICFRRINAPAKLKPKVKHPYKVHVWAGVRTRGTTDTAIFTGIMPKDFYVDTILSKYLVPFINEMFPDANHFFVQENDPKQKSKFTTLIHRVFLMAHIDSHKQNASLFYRSLCNRLSWHYL